MSSYSSRSMMSRYSSSLNSAGFPSPFLDMASLAMPDSWQDTLAFCERLFEANSTYRQGTERVNSYFNTDIDISSGGDELGDDEKDKWTTLFDEDMDVRTVELAANRDVSCYGNSFVSFVVPFTRFLACPKCSAQYRFEEVVDASVFRFKFQDMEFHATCPACKTGSGYRGPMELVDQPDLSPSKLRLKRWSPHEIKILHCPFTDDVRYFWEIPADYKQLIKQGRPYHLARVSKQVLKAIKHNQLFRFAPDVIYHFKEPTLAGHRNRGWGISRMIFNWRQIWYVQVLHRLNEAIALDYVIPFRLITPMPRSGAQGQSTDIALNVNLGDSMAQLRRMLAHHRRDPAAYHTLGFPVQYQILGAEASQLAPHELLSQGLDTLLNGAGIPTDLYKGSLQMQVAPVALRVFEATWHHVVHMNNMFLRWVVNRTSQLLGWEAVRAKHRRVTHADDMQRHMAILQMAMGGQVSLSSALRTLGLEFKDEQRNITEEARFQQQETSRIQEEQDQAAFAEQVNGPPAGGMMPQPGAAQGGAAGQPMPADPAIAAGPVSQMVASGTVPQTPDDMIAQAHSLAQQLLGLPEGMKDSELRALKQKNEVLHSLVVAELKKIRNQAQTQGGSMLLQQTYGGAGAQPAA